MHNSTHFTLTNYFNLNGCAKSVVAAGRMMPFAAVRAVRTRRSKGKLLSPCMALCVCGCVRVLSTHLVSSHFVNGVIANEIVCSIIKTRLVRLCSNSNHLVYVCSRFVSPTTTHECPRDTPSPLGLDVGCILETGCFE